MGANPSVLTLGVTLGVTMSVPLEIRPSPWRRLVIVLGLGGFTVAGLWLIVVGGLVAKFAGALAVLFFGVLGGWSLRQQWRRTVTLRLFPDRLEWVYPRGTAQLPWADVEAIGITEGPGATLVGLRLSSYDGYLASMTPEMRQWLDRANRAVGLAASAVSVVSDTPLGRAVSTVDGLREAMVVCRETYGYELTVGWQDLDRPKEQLVALLERYRAAAGPQ